MKKTIEILLIKLFTPNTKEDKFLDSYISEMKVEEFLQFRTKSFLL